MPAQKKVQMATKNFEIHFQGELAQMDVNTLITSLIGTSTIIQQANQLVDPERNVEIKIEPFAPGSFKILADLWTDPSARSLFVDGAGLLASVFSIFVGYLGLKKFLKGEAPQKIEKVGRDKISIKNIDGDVTVFQNPIYQLYMTNPVSNEASSKAFEVLDKDESVDGMQVKEGAKVVFEAPRAEFSHMAKKHNVETEEEREVMRDATLHIVKPSFHEGYSWWFYYDGNRITVTISDENFLNQVDEGKRFAKGDTLIVKLKIKQRYEKSVETYINDSYEIVEVEKHILRPDHEQQKLVE